VLADGCNFAVKISDPPLIEEEAKIHAMVDDCKHIRKSLGRVEVQWSGPPLSGIKLDGPALPFTADDVRKNPVKSFAESKIALDYMHERGILHRDVKLSNFMLVNGILQLNDFDCACHHTSPAYRAVVGTPKYRSPLFDAARGYQKYDDFLGLLLSFAEAYFDISDPLRSLLSIAQDPQHPLFPFIQPYSSALVTAFQKRPSQ